MSGALLTAGGHSVAEALDRLQTQITQAELRYRMAPVSAVRISVTPGSTTAAEIAHFALTVVPSTANVDWQGTAWRFVASVCVHV